MLVALGYSSGRLRLAHAMARDLHQNGRDVTLLVTPGAARHLGETEFACVPLPDLEGWDLAAHLVQATSSRKAEAAAIVLCDYVSNTMALRARHVDLRTVCFDNTRVFAVDLWDREVTADVCDVFGEQQAETEVCATGGVLREHVLLPVPFLSARRDGRRYFNALPGVSRGTSARGKETLERLGITGGEKVVLFSTAAWQHRWYPVPSAQELSRRLPQLISHYVATVGSDVHLVHVGTRPYDAGPLGSRYHWCAPLPVGGFDDLLAASDVHISANLAASTLTSAVLSGVPTLVLQNSCAAATEKDAQAHFGALSGSVRHWLAGALPIFRFAVWPLGYHRLMARLLTDNPYAEAVARTEILDEPATMGRLQSLLWNPETRATHRRGQQDYLRHVNGLPSLSQVVNI